MRKIVSSDASFSKCGLYRWWLRRKVISNERKLLFIGLNPSFAGKEVNDPTTTRLVNFCRAWGYGTLFIINLFAKVSSSSLLLKYSSNPVGNKNDSEISSRLDSWSNDLNWDLWLGWGARGTLRNRNIELTRVVKIFSKQRYKRFDKSRGPLVLGLTKGGHPMHPLYLPCKKLLYPFEIP